MNAHPQSDATIARRATTTLAIRVASASIAYLSQIVLARWLGLEQYGLFAAAWAWLLVAGGTLPLGFNVMVIGRLPTYAQNGDIAAWRGLAFASMAVTLVASGIVMGGGLVSLSVVPALFDNPLASLVMLGLLCVPLMALGEINEGIARAHGWIGSALLPTYILRPLLMLAAGGVVLSAGGKLDALVILQCAVFACAIASLGQAAWLLASMSRLHPGREVRLALWTWFGLSLPMLATELCEMLLASLDLFFVAAVMGSEPAGIYFAAQRTIALVAFVGFAVGVGVAPAVVAARCSGDRGDLARQVRLAATLSFWPTLAGVIVLVGASPWLLSLFGSDFAEGLVVVSILAIGFLARSFVGPAELLFNVLGAQRACAIILAGNLALGLVLNAVLVPAYGLAGAASATTLAMLGLAVSFHIYARARLGLLMLPGAPIPAFSPLVLEALEWLTARGGPLPGSRRSPDH